jgi:hypothetical protein
VLRPQAGGQQEAPAVPGRDLGHCLKPEKRKTTQDLFIFLIILKKSSAEHFETRIHFL